MKFLANGLRFWLKHERFEHKCRGDSMNLLTVWPRFWEGYLTSLSDAPVEGMSGNQMLRTIELRLSKSSKKLKREILRMVTMLAEGGQFGLFNRIST